MERVRIAYTVVCHFVNEAFVRGRGGQQLASDCRTIVRSSRTFRRWVGGVFITRCTFTITDEWIRNDATRLAVVDAGTVPPGRDGRRWIRTGCVNSAAFEKRRKGKQPGEIGRFPGTSRRWNTAGVVNRTTSNRSNVAVRVCMYARWREGRRK